MSGLIYTDKGSLHCHAWLRSRKKQNTMETYEVYDQTCTQVDEINIASSLENVRLLLIMQLKAQYLKNGVHPICIPIPYLNQSVRPTPIPLTVFL